MHICACEAILHRISSSFFFLWRDQCRSRLSRRLYRARKRWPCGPLWLILFPLELLLIFGNVKKVLRHWMWQCKNGFASSDRLCFDIWLQLYDNKERIPEQWTVVLDSKPRTLEARDYAYRDHTAAIVNVTDHKGKARCLSCFDRLYLKVARPIGLQLRARRIR